MGTDDLFKKRKAKSNQELKRKEELKKDKPHVLIVCEGEKTEPQYFQEIVELHGITSAVVKIHGECDSAPISVVEEAVKLYDNSVRNGLEYDNVFCVFDRDEHTSYDQALIKIDQLKEANFKAIVSNPCFEYWFILHYEFTTQPYSRQGNNSAAKLALNHLRKHDSDYQKKTKGSYLKLSGKTYVAIANAEKSRFEADKTGSVNPTTNVDELVSFLLEI